MSLRLKIEHGQDAGHTWRLQQPGLYVIGRDANSAIRVLDMKVSKGHCEIGLSNGSEGAAWIRDLKSTHGTQLNGQPLSKEAPLKPGDEIRLGFTVLRLLSDGPADAVAAPTAPLPPPAPKQAAPTNGGGKPAGAAAAAGAAPGVNVTAPWAKDSLAGVTTDANQVPTMKTLPPDEMVGKTLGGYHVLRKIGQGGMGSVYVAEQVSLKREVALKVLSEKFVADSAFVDQFLNEARAAGQLNHPNVVQVYDVGRAEGRYFFSMEFVPGGAIEDRIKGNKSAEWSEALNWFLDATNALIFAQKRGILHRDVKPDNLMLAEDGSAKLCDLGLAKKSESADLLAQGIIGTPHYLSPETIRRKSDIDYRTDLYSLGCTFYRILSGENPYPAKTVKDILLGHLNKPVPRVTDKKADVPKDVSDAVFKLMQKEPADRYTSADELYNALDKIRIQHGLAAHGIKPGSKKPLIIAVIVALLAAAAVIFLVSRPLTKEPEDPATKERREAAERAAEEKRKEGVRGLREGYFKGLEGELSTIRSEARDLNPEKTWNVKRAWEAWFASLAEFRDKVAGHSDYKDDPDTPAMLKKVDDLKAEIEKDLQFHRDNAAGYKTATEAHEKVVDGALEGHVKAYEALLRPVEGQVALPWWKAAAMMTRESVEALLKPLRERKFQVEGHAPRDLMTDKDLEERARRLMPGPDRIGQDHSDRAVRSGATAHAEALQRLATPQGETPKDLQAAAEVVEKYREAIEEPDPQRIDEIAEKQRQQRADAQRKAGDLREKALNLEEKVREGDRRTIHKLYQMLWEPKRGALAVFRWIPDDEPRRLVGELKDAAYQRLGAEALADFTAFTKVFASLKNAFDNKLWTDPNVEGTDGKPQKVAEVTSEGITCPAVFKTPRIWADFTAPVLLNKVFYVKPGTPRFPFGPEDLRGLALLAEMSGDEAQATEHWKKYAATLTPEQSGLAADVVLRLTRLPKAMEAVRKWKEAADHMQAIEDIGTKSQLPTSKDGALKDPQRDAIQREKATLEGHQTEAGQLLSELWMNAELAATMWGAAMRSETHPRAAFTGEQIPAGVANPNPLDMSPPPDPAPVPDNKPPR